MAFFPQMCEDEAQGTDVLSSGGGQYIFATKSTVWRQVSCATAQPQGLSGCFHHTGGREVCACVHHFQAAS